MKQIMMSFAAGLVLSGAAIARPVPSDAATLPRTFADQPEVAWLPWWLVNGPVCMVNPGPLCVRK
jgi:hypothetical protein